MILVSPVHLKDTCGALRIAAPEIVRYAHKKGGNRTTRRSRSASSTTNPMWEGLVLGIMDRTIAPSRVGRKAIDVEYQGSRFGEDDGGDQG